LTSLISITFVRASRPASVPMRQICSAVSPPETARSRRRVGSADGVQVEAPEDRLDLRRGERTAEDLVDALLLDLLERMDGDPLRLGVFEIRGRVRQRLDPDFVEQFGREMILDEQLAIRESRY